LARQAGADMVFWPKAAGMYPRGFQTSVEVGRLAKHLCGLTRPRLFGGVCVVVAKLFEIVRPDIAYFGQKDYQQFVILSQMVRDLNMDVRLKMMPIVRDRDGLALSSRNQYLSGHQRKLAISLYQALRAGRSAIKKRKIKDARTVERVMHSTIPHTTGIKIEYLQVCDPDTLDRPRKITSPVLLAGALWVGKTRLIDNILVR
jgi:pantoate--beta-alanine ligase